MIRRQDYVDLFGSEEKGTLLTRDDAQFFGSGEVVHDETLSGKGTADEPLGVNASGAFVPVENEAHSTGNERTILKRTSKDANKGTEVTFAARQEGDRYRTPIECGWSLTSKFYDDSGTYQGEEARLEMSHSVKRDGEGEAEPHLVYTGWNENAGINDDDIVPQKGVKKILSDELAGGLPGYVKETAGETHIVRTPDDLGIELRKQWNSPGVSGSSLALGNIYQAFDNADSPEWVRDYVSDSRGIGIYSAEYVNQAFRDGLLHFDVKRGFTLRGQAAQDKQAGMSDPGAIVTKRMLDEAIAEGGAAEWVDYY